MSMSLSICLSQCHLKTMEKLSDKTMSSIYVVVVVVVVVVHSRIRHRCGHYTTSTSSEIIIIYFTVHVVLFLSPLPSWPHINRHNKHTIDTPNFFPMHMFRIAHHKILLLATEFRCRTSANSIW